MVFTSIIFSVFFILFFIFYWAFNKNLKIQNSFLLLGSYIFYGWVDWRLLSYLLAVSIINYYLGILIEKSTKENVERIYLRLGILQGVGGLFYFKYFNFFIESFNSFFKSIHLDWNIQTLRIIIPLGISFFTFKTLSYLLDIYNGKISTTKDWVVFFNYIAFFPTLLSGPIDRADTFIPQLKNKRNFDNSMAVDGLRQILWGVFKKIVIADNLALISNPLFNNYLDQSSSTLIYGIFLYTIQLYADFSGYSDMAIGVSRLLGFKVTKNFDFPFFGQNIAEFWRKWHISLTSWMTDYLFTPLSFLFRDLNKMGLILAIVINFIIIGIWHGANWTYVLYGLVHGLYFIPLIISGKLMQHQKVAKKGFLNSLIQFKNILGTFLLVMLANVIFRSETISKAFEIYQNIFSLKSFFDFPKVDFLMIGMVFFLFIVEWMQRLKNHALENLQQTLNQRVFRWVFYIILLLFIIGLGGNQQEFIYFQF